MIALLLAAAGYLGLALMLFAAGALLLTAPAAFALWLTKPTADPGAAADDWPVRR